MPASALRSVETTLSRSASLSLPAARSEVALFQPPSHRRFWLRAGPFCERVGQRVWRRYAGGVLMIEAVKDTFRPSGTLIRDAKPDPLRVLEGISQPARDNAVARAGADRFGRN